MAIHTERQAVRRSCGFCFQQNVIYDELTVRQHLQIISRIRDIAPAEREREARLTIIL